MDNLILFGLGVLVSIIGYFVKKGFDRLDAHDKALEAIKLNCVSCNAKVLDELLDRFSKMMDEKLDAWWSKVENGLMNDGRLPPRKSRSNDAR